MFQDYGQSVIHSERTGISSLKPMLVRWRDYEDQIKFVKTKRVFDKRYAHS